jgi:hypothetical protein
MAVLFRRRRIGFRHCLPTVAALSGYGAAGPESGEENNPDNPACLAEALAKAGNHV